MNSDYYLSINDIQKMISVFKYHLKKLPILGNDTYCIVDENDNLVVYKMNAYYFIATGIVETLTKIIFNAESFSSSNRIMSNSSASMNNYNSLLSSFMFPSYTYSNNKENIYRNQTKPEMMITYDLYKYGKSEYE